MKYKLLIFLLMLANNCLALVFQPDTIAISNGVSHNTLDEDGYDMTADTIANYLNKPIQHLMNFQNDTIQLRISVPKDNKGYYRCGNDYDQSKSNVHHNRAYQSSVCPFVWGESEKTFQMLFERCFISVFVLLLFVIIINL